MTANLNVARVSDGVSSPNQLSLPTGPVGLVRPRRARTDEDRDFLADAFKVTAGGRLCEGGLSVPCLLRKSYGAEDCLSEPKHHRGLLRAKRSTSAARSSQTRKRRFNRMSRTQARAVFFDLLDSQPGHGVPFNPDMVSDEEGRKDKETRKALSVSADVQSQDHAQMEKTRAKRSICLLFLPLPEAKSKARRRGLSPSQSRSRSTASSGESWGARSITQWKPSSTAYRIQRRSASLTTWKRKSERWRMRARSSQHPHRRLKVAFNRRKRSKPSTAQAVSTCQRMTYQSIAVSAGLTSERSER